MEDGVGLGRSVDADNEASDSGDEEHAHEDGEWYMALIRSFRDLNVYKAARREAKIIFDRSRSFPREERYALTDQIRRSSRAVKAMIAEA